jgi:hypothetical protein
LTGSTGWSESFALNSCQTENSHPKNFCFYATSLAYISVKLFCPVHLILKTPCIYSACLRLCFTVLTTIGSASFR